MVSPKKVITTLCLLYKEPYLLLGMKKVGFGAGRWNGFGGKVQEGEFIEEAARRELREEAGIEALNIEKRGLLTFRIDSLNELIEVYLFGASECRGDPIETQEMRPQWFHKNEIPFDKMWPDDKYWMPLFIAGKKFKGHFHFADIDTLISYVLEEISEVGA